MNAISVSLNAPCGAGCFLAADDDRGRTCGPGVLMHLLVLGAF